MNIGRLEATLGVDTKGLQTAQTAMENFQKSTQISMASVAQTLDKTGRNIYYFGTASMRFLTLPLTLAGAASFKMAKDFESSMQKIVGLVGVSQTQVDAWSKQILQLGPALGKSPKELADALYFITSSGFKGAEALQILTNSAKAASAGLGDTKSIADLVTSAMNAYGNSNLTSSKILDTLTAAVREGKGEASDFAKQLGDVIPIASRMGVSFDQVAAAISSVTLTGQNVSEAVTGIRQTLFSIQHPAAGATYALKTMGLSFDDLRNSLAQNGLLPTLKTINNLTKQYGEEVLSKVFPNIRAFNVVLSLLGDRYEKNKALQIAVTNSTGDMMKAFEVAANTMEMKYNQAVASAQTAMIEFGIALKGPITSLLMGFSNAIRGIAEWFTHLSTGTQQFLLKFGVFLAVLGPATIAIGLLMRGFSGLYSTILFVKNAMQLLYTTMVANPLIAFIAVLGTLAITAFAVSKAINSSTKEQVAYNDALEEGKRIAQTYHTVEEKMQVLADLNKSQILELKQQIIEQLKLADTYDAQVMAKRKAIESQVNFDKLYNDQQKKNHAQEVVGFATMQNELLAKQQKSNKDRISALNGYITTVESRLKQLTGKTVTVNVSTGEDPTSKMEAHKRILEEYDATLKKVGRDLKQVNLMESLDEAAGPIENYRLHFLRLSDAGDTLQKKLADIALTTATFDSSFDVSANVIAKTSAQVDFLKSKLQNLWDQGYRPGIELNDVSLKQEGDRYAALLKTTSALENQQKMYSQIGQQMMSTLLQGADSWEAYGETVKNTVIDIIAAYAAQAISMAIISAMESSISLGPLGLALIPALVGLAIGAVRVGLNQIPGFAEGGVVPGGFPNDTYLARLSSGETIIPAGKPLSSAGIGSSLESTEVEFRVSGYDLVAVLNKYSKKLNKV
jgi:TP901 family phage tail tape measure protein